MIALKDPDAPADPAPIPLPEPSPSLPAKAAVTSLTWPTILAAFLLLGLFLWMTYEMFINRMGETDANWARSLTIYTSIESFALAAAGVLLGTQIQAGRVKAAEERAERKEQEADAQRKRANEVEDDLGGYRAAVRDLRLTLGDAERPGLEAAVKDDGLRRARRILDELV